MKTSLSRRQLNRRASLTGLGVSILLHGAVAGIFAKFYEELKPISEEKSVKIALNTFTPPAAPLPPAPTPPAPPPPAPPAPPPPEPVVTPPPPEPEPPKPTPPPEPIEKPKPVEKPKPAEKPVEKPKPKTKPKPLKKPEPEPKQQVAQVAPPAPPSPPTPTPPTAQPSSAPSSSISSNLPPSGVETVGEFNFATSAGDDRFYKIQKAIQKRHKYPKRAKKMRHQGVVEVSFLYKKDGTVRDVKVIKSSGYETLDETAVELINCAAPDFPILDRDYVIKIPVSYKLM